MAGGPLAGVLPLGLRLQPVLRPPRHHLVRVRGRRSWFMGASIPRNPVKDKRNNFQHTHLENVQTSDFPFPPEL